MAMALPATKLSRTSALTHPWRPGFAPACVTQTAHSLRSGAQRVSSRPSHLPLLQSTRSRPHSALLPPPRCSPPSSSSSSSYTPYPFVEADYFEVELIKRPYEPIVFHHTDNNKYVLTLQKSDEPSPLREATPCLEVVVQGDTAKSLCLQLEGGRPERPVAIDLLLQVLQRGMAISKRDWKLLRVAVVGVAERAYLGRLFFGDAATEEVVWDCDCRPSDAFWLALSMGAPILVRRSVWLDHAVKLQDTNTYRKAHEHQHERVVEVTTMPTSKPLGAAAWRPRPIGRGGPATSDVEIEDPEEIKLLKREMEVAVKEEDYSKAAALREHPYMRLYVQMRRMYLEGADDHAAQLQRQLMDLIQENQHFGSNRSTGTVRY